MTRQLPWKRKSEVEPSPASSRTPNRQHASPTPGAGLRAKNVSTPTPASSASKKIGSSLAVKRGRSPSTSPPPAPPPEEFMLEGVDADDGYRMVEDELASVAKMFTAHLHAAEYHRLKTLAKSQNADTIKDISRPVVERMSTAVQRKQNAASLAKRQRSGLKRARTDAGDGGDTDDESPWSGTALAGLMDAPKTTTSLKNVITATSGTRAAAGYQQRSPAKATRHGLNTHGPASPTSRARNTIPKTVSDTDDDDDLDRPVRDVPKRVPTKPSSAFTATPTPNRSSTFPSVSTSKSAPSSVRSSTFSSVPTPRNDEPSDDDMDPMDFLRKAREERRAKEGANRRKSQQHTKQDKPDRPSYSSLMVIPFL